MSERISFFTHKGKTIMFLDFSHISEKENMALLDEVRTTVARHEKNSVLILADLTGTHMDRAIAQHVKEVLVFDKPYVKRAAWFGAASVPKVYMENFKSFSRRELPVFESREEALEWLVAE